VADWFAKFASLVDLCKATNIANSDKTGLFFHALFSKAGNMLVVNYQLE
jgi:hypothetical protein